MAVIKAIYVNPVRLRPRRRYRNPRLSAVRRSARASGRRRSGKTLTISWAIVNCRKAIINMRLQGEKYEQWRKDGIFVPGSAGLYLHVRAALSGIGDGYKAIKGISLSAPSGRGVLKNRVILPLRAHPAQGEATTGWEPARIQDQRITDIYSM